MSDPLAAAGASAVAARGGGLRVLAWGGSAVLSLVSIPLLVRHLGVPEFGRYVAVMAVVNIAALGSDLGLTSLALRDWGALEPAERAPRLRALVRLRLGIVALAAACAVIFAAAAGWPGRQVGGTAIAAAGIFGQVVIDFATVALAGSLRFGRLATVELARAALGTLLIAALVIAGAGLLAFFVAWSVAALAGALLALRVARPLLSGIWRGNAASGPRALLRETATYTAASMLHVVYFRTGVLVVSVASSARQAGLFGAVFRISEFAAAVGSAVAGALTPLLAHAERTDSRRLRREALRMVATATGVGVVAALVLGLGAPVIMPLLGGDALQGSVPVMRIAAPALVATFASFAIGAVLLVLRRYRELFAVNLGALGVVLALALALVPAHGAKGAAVAVLCGEWCIALGQALALWRALAKLPRPPLPSAP